MTYPLIFRQKVLTVREKEGLTIAEVAVRFCVGVASVTRWLKTPVPQTTRNKPATKIDMEALARDVQERPDAYQFERARQLGVSTQCVNYALRRLGVTYKKNTEAPEGQRRRTASLPKSYRRA